MPAFDWCYVDELEPGDHLYVDDARAEVEVLTCDLVRAPSGPCMWRVETSGPTIRYEVLDRVPRVAA
jgi:hypothetical protein